VLLFVAFALLAAAPVHYFALRALQPHQEVPYFGALVLLAVLFSIAIVERMIPGSKRRISGRMLVLLTFCGLAALCAGLFGWSHFAQGWGCLRFGSLCMLAGGLLAALFVRTGFVTSPVETSTIVGLFAGIAGFAALALHCSVLNATHILVWHLGTVVLGGAAGALMGVLLQARMRRSSTS